MAKRTQNKANQSVKKSLDLFLPAVREWFSREVGEPSPPQAQAWPHIAAGENVLIHAPTGSGKTFAAFLSAINDLFANTPGRQPASKGVRVLYISPLKALNNDIERNLRDPLDGIRRIADEAGEPLPGITAEVRTGDTPPSARARMVRKPPQILITTPESLYLILTSPQARNMLKTVRTVIIDEIHSLSGTKRGVHLSLSLERLERLSPGFQRIGLSATQRPLEEVARFLGGQEVAASTDGIESTPRPVRIVDAAYKKKIDVQLIGMPDREIGEDDTSLWQKIIPSTLEDIRANRTTLIFANSRRQAERTADRLNAQLHAEVAALDPESDDPPLMNGGWTADSPDEGPFHAHHGSVSDETRRELEQALKAGELPALVGTSSLELGIDIGTVDLVVQLQSPKTVTQGLQRVGRSGHRVGETSHYKIYATHEEDLLEAAVIARGMMDGDVERVYTPQNALDVLSQQIIAAVAVDDWRVDDLFRLVRGAYPYHALERTSFVSALRLVSGKFPRHVFSNLRARVNWDEPNGMLRALPGTRMHAVDNGGAIVDRGAFPVYMPDGKTRIGELDEEFVYETKEGDAFVLGSQVWRAAHIDDDRVIVEPAAGATPRMPFWRGDFPWRPLQLSNSLAAFKSEVARRLEPHVEEDVDPPDVSQWLRDEYRCDEAAARQIISYVRRQLRSTGRVASDRSIVVETYQDPIGDFRIVVHSIFGGKVNGPWSVALASVIKEWTGIEPEVQVSDDGILFRLPQFDDDLPEDIVTALSPDETRERALMGLTDSALFGALFRQNAQRALLLPGIRRGRRTPFWLQRLRSKDLLSVSRGFPDFPIMLETFRDCLEDAMDLPGLLDVVERVRAGDIEVVHHRSLAPSPVARALNFAFEAWFMYQWDAPKAERAVQTLGLDRAQLAALVRDPSFAGTLRQEALDEVSAQVSHTAPGRHARSATELAQLLQELGDLNEEEAASRSDGDHSEWLAQLESEGRASQALLGPAKELRWVSAEQLAEYQSLASLTENAGPMERDVLRAVLRRFLGRSGPTTEADIVSRYGLPPRLLADELEAMAADDELAWGYFTSSADDREWAVSRNLERIQARTLSILRSEIKPSSPLRLQAEVSRLQRLTPERRLKGPDGAREALTQLKGIAASPADWTARILPARVTGFSMAAFEQLLRDGEFVAALDTSQNVAGPLVRIVPRGEGSSVLPDAQLAHLESASDNLSAPGADVFAFIRSEGAATSADIRAAFPSLSLSEVRSALSSLLVSGAITTDSWQALVGSLQDDQRVESGAAPTRPASGVRQRSMARRQAARRVKELTASLPPQARWFAVNRFGTLGPPLDPSRRAQARAEALLNRYGVVSRRAIELEGAAWEWQPIASALSLMELRGAVRRGYFVLGLPGVQFALPDMVERLREPRRAGSDDFTVIRLTDPAYVLDKRLADADEVPEANLARASRLSSSELVFHGDRPVLLSEANGERLSPGVNASSDSLRTAVRSLRDSHVPHGGSFAAQVSVREWAGQSVIGSEGEKILEDAGFRRDYPAMTFDALQATALSVR